MWQRVTTYRQAIGAALICLVALCFLIQSGQIRQLQQPGHLGPTFWPRLILGGLLLCGLIKGILAVKGTRGRDDRPAATAAEVSPGTGWKLALGILLVLAYVYLTELVGFPLANCLFLGAFMFVGGVHQPLRLALLSILGTVGLLYLFAKAVYVPLPRGMGIFEDLTIALYRGLRIF